MKFSFWPTGDYPIYINPSTKDMFELAATGFDTVRICVEDELLAVASGYGNTHQSVIDAVRQSLKIKRWHPETYILFKENNQYWFNLEDISGDRKVFWRDVKSYFSDEHWNLISDLITNC